MSRRWIMSADRSVAVLIPATLVAGILGIGAASAAPTGTGYGQGVFDSYGIYGASVGVVGHPTGITGYRPAPAIYSCAGGVHPSLTETFTVQRYTGKNHVPYTQAVSIPAQLELLKVTANSDGLDTPANLLAGDPQTSEVHDPVLDSNSPPPYSEAYLLKNSTLLTETLESATPFAIDLPALPLGTSDATAAAQTQSFTFPVTLPGCGYYAITSGAEDATNTVRHPPGFKVLTSSFVRSSIGTGYGQGNLDPKGAYNAEVGIVGLPRGDGGYDPAPGITHRSDEHFSTTFSFTVNRYTGKHHVPYTSAITIPIQLELRHLTAISDGLDTAGAFANGDPSITAQTMGASPPPYTEDYLLAHSTLTTQSLISTDGASITLPALPTGTTDADAALQTQAFHFTVTGSGRGYYSMAVVAPDATAPGGFAGLTSGYIRVG